MRHEKIRGKDEYFYILKWQGYSGSHNTREAEVHTCT